MINNISKLNVLSKSLNMIFFHSNIKRTFYLTATLLTKCPPRKRISVEKRWRKKTNLAHFFPMTRSWHNIIQCDTCGNYHRKWLLCSTCYDQTRYETEIVRKVLKEKGKDLSQRTVLKYKDDITKDLTTNNYQVVNLQERNRPSGWFNEKYWNKI